MMKNKFLYALLAAVVLGFSLSSCAKEDVNGTDPEKPAVPEGEPGYLSFKLNSAPATRNTPAPGIEDGVDGEDCVGIIWMLLYNTGGTLEYAWNLDAKNHYNNTMKNFEGYDVVTENYATRTPTQFVTTGREVVSKEYKLVIIANPDCYYKDNYVQPIDFLTGFTAIGSNPGTGINSEDPFYKLSNLLAANNGEEAFDGKDNRPFIYGGGSTQDAASDVFMMTNANGVIQVLPTHLQKDKETAERNPVAVSLDRGVAKIMLNEASTGTPVKTGGTLQSVKWGLENINTKAYAIRRFTYLTGDNEGDNHYRGDMEIESNSVDNRGYQYAEDPNFSSHNTNDFRNDEVDDFINWNKNGQDEDDDTWKYAYENTMDFTTQAGGSWANATTQIVVNAVITYDFAMDDDPDSKDYYSWNAGTTSDPKWRVFSHAQVIYWMQNGYPGDMAGLKTLAGYTDGSEIFQNGTSSFFATGGTESDKPTVTGDLPMVQDTDEKITFHKGGFNQYKIPIKHFNGTYSTLDTEEAKRKGVYGYYGVVRNNVYRVTINSINGPGTPTSGWLSAIITINPWQQRTQSEDL